MSEIPKAYEPQAVEDRWYRFWLKQGCFTADPARVSDKRQAYSIVIPPPNVTGMLHMGHVLNNTIQDILARKARMDGKEVLWLPGTDHAGIATQVQVEKALKKAEKKTKHDLGREEFLKRVWAWKEKHGGIIIQQLKKLGCSCDWTRERFTMDSEYSRCVQKVFFKLYKKGLIYRGKRMVNWDPATRTALSDEEVEMKETKGHLWHLKYPMLDDGGRPKADEFVVVATTRPETMLGDEAVAVNPNDERYTKLVGRRLLLPLQNKPIPVIADDFVDPKFGTGCVKVTPAHDPNDYAMALRHKLPITVVIGQDGHMTKVAGGGFAGLDRMEARKSVVEHLERLGLLLKVEDYVHNVGYSQRSNVPIEPMLSTQWFLKYPSVPASKACAAEGRMKYHPDRWAKVYDHWLTNIQDWCISRQLWWGHRIPVWRMTPRCTGELHRKAESLLEKNKREFPDLVEVRHALDENYVPSTPEMGIPVVVEVCIDPKLDCLAKELEDLRFEQDPDVLDTWFSSWLWPFATMGWPEQTETLKKFYPTTDLVTGPDIIFFWVARMIMAGYEFMGEPKFSLPDAMPFRNVYFTGIIRDKQGRKMSKTLGNSPDPLELIAKYGADALRFGTMRSAPLGQDVLFDEKDVELGRNFCNKLWNACRFRQMQGGGGRANSQVQGEINPSLLSNDDKWILLKLNQAILEITEAFTKYKFNEATATLYRFFWSEYCDWYVEASKAVFFGSDAPRKANTLAVIDFVLSHTLRLFHPFLPFITEELWHGMGYSEDMPKSQGGKTIMNAPWPKPFDSDFRDHYGLDDCYLEFAEQKYEVVTQGRNLRRIGNIQSGKKVKFVLKPNREILPHDAEVMKILLNAEAIEINANFAAKKGTPTAHTPFGELCLPLEGLVDVEAEKARLRKEVEKAEAEIAKVEQKLSTRRKRTCSPVARGCWA